MVASRIRIATSADVEGASELVLRLKKLNGEFDPLFAVSANATDACRHYLSDSIKDAKSLVLVSEQKGKIVGLLKADLRDRTFYQPRKEGAIVEFYILPEYRRKRLGEELIEEAVKALKRKGAQIITAEFPSQNQIAVNFYSKRGYRPLVSVYATEKV